MKPRPIHWIIGTAFVLAYARFNAWQSEDEERAEAHRQEAIAAEQQRLAERERARADAQALARHLYEQHLLDDANRMLAPIGQARLAARE